MADQKDEDLYTGFVNYIYSFFTADPNEGENKTGDGPWNQHENKDSHDHLMYNRFVKGL